MDLFIKELGVSGREFAKQCGFSESYYATINDGIGVNKVNIILSRFPEISAAWLLTGEGDMLREPGSGLPSGLASSQSLNQAPSQKSNPKPTPKSSLKPTPKSTQTLVVGGQGFVSMPLDVWRLIQAKDRQVEDMISSIRAKDRQMSDVILLLREQIEKRDNE